MRIMYSKCVYSSIDDCVYEIQSDGFRVWVNSDRGWCIGRFSMQGYEVNRESRTIAVASAGAPQWDEFKRLMLEYFGIVVDDKHMPQFLRKDAA